MKTPEPDPLPDLLTEAQLMQALSSAGLLLRPAEVPGVLFTARFLAQARARVADLAGVADEPR